MKHTVIATLHGGLGNQMFIYAAARRLAYVQKAELVLVLSDNFGRFDHRRYGLDAFQIAGSLVERDSLYVEPKAAAQRPQKPLEIVRILRETFIWGLPPHTTPAAAGGGADLLFMPQLLNWRGSVRLDGYWQDERYFADIAKVIRSDFGLKQSLDPRNREALMRIEMRPSAFMHVRRGDYLHPAQEQTFGICDLPYYRDALAALRERVGGDLAIFVFSDDPDWARQNQIGGDGAAFIDWNGDAPERDLALMRACKHAIIANSSFSWWGAWLGEQPGGTVIAPRIWFKSQPHFQEIVPRRWLRV